MTRTVAPQRRSSEASNVVAAGTARPRLWALDGLRIAAILGVVAIHVIGLRVANRHAPHNGSWWAAVTVDLGSNWVVPVFVMISGALVLAPRAHAAGVTAFYRRRLIRILPALVVWHVVYLVGIRLLLRGEHITRTGLLSMLIDGKVFTALYFLWLIAGLYAVAPILAAFLRGGGPRRAMFLAAGALSWTLVAWTIPRAAAVAGIERPVSIGAWTQWWPYVGYFVAGWALHRIVLARRGMLVAALVAAAALSEIIWQYGTSSAHPLLNALLPLSYISVQTAVASGAVFLFALGLNAHLRPGPRTVVMLRRLSEASFGVFLCHLVFLEIARKLVPAVAAADSLTVLGVTYVCVVVLSFALSLVASRIPYVRAVF